MSLDQDLVSEADDLVRMAGVLARTLRVKELRLQPTLDTIVAAAAELSHFQAGLVLVERGQLIPQAVTGQAPHSLDLRQQERRTGPCIEAAETQEVVRITDTRDDSRWAGFGALAFELGVRSMLCFPLWIDEACLGTLSLYADRPDAFTPQDERIAMVCATLAAVSIADSSHADQLRTALDNRDVIGQAKGILMERGKITADAAFAILTHASQRRNRKLHVLARHLVETGELLGEIDPLD